MYSKRKVEINLLSRRHEIEKKFHDRWARRIKDEDVNYLGSFLADTASENKYALLCFGNIKGKRILDLGCGIGDASLFLASRGALVTSVDISPEMVKIVRRLSKKYMLAKRIKARTMLAEKLILPAEHFDFIFGNGILHHVDTNTTLSEVYRVLKKGGKAVFIEPLEHNPIINIYRRIATEVRTLTEKPLNFNRLEHLTRVNFKKVHHKEFHFFTLLIFVWFFLVERVDPNKERYWKKIIDDSSRIAKPFSILMKIDQKVVKMIPRLGRFYWNTVIVYEK
jgi:ubiquinone/menaquinone biosynthesis C-methylase UbiE